MLFSVIYHNSLYCLEPNCFTKIRRIFCSVKLFLNFFFQRTYQFFTLIFFYKDKKNFRYFQIFLKLFLRLGNQSFTTYCQPNINFFQRTYRTFPICFTKVGNFFETTKPFNTFFYLYRVSVSRFVSQR